MPRYPRLLGAFLLSTSAALTQLASAQTPPQTQTPQAQASQAQTSQAETPQAQTPVPARKVVQLVAERFAFMPSEIVVEEGTLLDIQLTSDDTNHGFRIKGTKTNAIIPKRGRGTISVPFDALTPGRYAFECSKMCGAGHSTMKGAIVVKPRAPSASPDRQER